MSIVEQTADSPVEAAIVQDMREVGIMPRREATVMERAAVIAGSRDFPDCRTPEKAAVRIMAGDAMKLDTVSAVSGIRVTNGRVSMDACLMAGVIERSEHYRFRKVELTGERAVIEFFRDGESLGISEFSLEDCKTAKLLGKETYQKYLKAMLWWRALSQGARMYCAGVFGGAVYVHEELGYAVDEEGRAVESGVDGNGGNGADNELCTRDQRQQLCRLVEAVGDSMPQFMAKMGIRLLDELSGYEAAKEIKRLEKRATKAGVPTGYDCGRVPDNPSLSDPAPSLQQTLADGFTESRRPSTPNQWDAILGLAQFLVPDEDECHEMLMNALAKRNCRTRAELNHLQAATLIEALQVKIKEQKQAGEENCPFDEAPRLPGMS